MTLWERTKRTGAVIVVTALAVGFLGLAEKSQDACHDRQRLYDSEIKYTRFLGRQLHATPLQIDNGVVALHKDLGPRPSC